MKLLPCRRSERSKDEVLCSRTDEAPVDDPERVDGDLEEGAEDEEGEEADHQELQGRHVSKHPVTGSRIEEPVGERFHFFHLMYLQTEGDRTVLTPHTLAHIDTKVKTKSTL